MANNYEKVTFFKELEEVKQMRKDAIQEETQMQKSRDEQFRKIGQLKGESEREMLENNRKSITSTGIYDGKDYTVRLVQAEGRREDSLTKGFPSEEPVRRHKTDKQKSFSLKKALCAGALSITLLTGAGTVMQMDLTVNDPLIQGNEIVSVIDAGDYHPQLEGYDLVAKANGDFSFRDANGNMFNVYGEGEFAISADDLGHSIENSSKQM